MNNKFNEWFYWYFLHCSFMIVMKSAGKKFDTMKDKGSLYHLDLFS